MAGHAFVDETKTRGVVMTAAVLLPGDLAAARRVIRSLVMPGQRRIHFVNESDGRRKKILDAMVELTPVTTIYDGSALAHRTQREACLRALIADLAAGSMETLVLERDDSIVALDQRTLYRAVRELGCAHLRYLHMRAHEEPLLAIPDAVAWCWQRGGAWWSRVRELVSDVRRLECP